MASIPKYVFEHSVEVMNLGDVHRGSPAHDNRLFRRAVDYVAKTPNCYWISTGDILDVALKTSLSDVYTAAPLEKELRDFMGEVAGITDKCLGIVASNHHKRFERAVGMSLDHVICDYLGVPYLGVTGVIDIVCGRSAYYTVMHHGFGGGRTRGAKANNLEKMGEIIPGADLYMSGHTHTFSTFPVEVPYIDRKRGLLVPYQATFVCTAHFMTWKGSYGEEKMYKPTVSGAAHVVLHANASGTRNNKRIDVSLFN